MFNLLMFFVESCLYTSLRTLFKLFRGLKATYIKKDCTYKNYDKSFVTQNKSQFSHET